MSLIFAKNPKRLGPKRLGQCLKCLALVVMGGLCFLSPSWAATADGLPEGPQQLDLEVLIQRIEQARADHERVYAAQQRLCYQKFAVNACLRELRIQKRVVMEDLRRQEVLINDEGRKRRGVDAIDRLEQRLQDKQDRDIPTTGPTR
jgi:hypothetical protein